MDLGPHKKSGQRAQRVIDLENRTDLRDKEHLREIVLDNVSEVSEQNVESPQENYSPQNPLKAQLGEIATYKF